jgi:hypothetical protein
MLDVERCRPEEGNLAFGLFAWVVASGEGDAVSVDEHPSVGTRFRHRDGRF